MTVQALEKRQYRGPRPSVQFCTDGQELGQELASSRRAARRSAVRGGPQAFRRPRRPPGAPRRGLGRRGSRRGRRGLPWTDGGMDAAADGDDDEVVCLSPMPTRSAVAPEASADSLCSRSAATSRRGTSPPPPRRRAAAEGYGCPKETSDDAPICPSVCRRRRPRHGPGVRHRCRDHPPDVARMLASRRRRRPPWQSR